MSVYERPLRPDELMHYGVKGMKWGVRKRRENVNRFYTQPNQKRKININGKKVAAGVAGVAGAAALGYGAYRLAKSGKASQYADRALDAYGRLRDTKTVKTINKGLDKTRKVRNAIGWGMTAVDVAQGGKYLYDNRNKLKTKQGRKQLIAKQRATAKTSSYRKKKVASIAVSTLMKL